MNRAIAVTALAVCMAALGGCTGQVMPSYEQVRQETLDVLREVTDLIPEHGAVSRTPEFEPYPCDDKLLLSSAEGAFFTGQWYVPVEDDFDIALFIDQFPEKLNGDWAEEDLGVPVKEPFVYLVRRSPRMTIPIEESTSNGRKAVELLAISRCGIEEQQPTP